MNALASIDGDQIVTGLMSETAASECLAMIYSDAKSPQMDDSAFRDCTISAIEECHSARALPHDQRGISRPGLSSSLQAGAGFFNDFDRMPPCRNCAERSRPCACQRKAEAARLTQLRAEDPHFIDMRDGGMLAAEPFTGAGLIAWALIFATGVAAWVLILPPLVRLVAHAVVALAGLMRL